METEVPEGWEMKNFTDKYALSVIDLFRTDDIRGCRGVIRNCGSFPLHLKGV